MLILPAITMEKATYCGNTHHTHTASCYEPSEEILDEDDISGSTGSSISASTPAHTWANSLSIEGIEEVRTGGEDEGLAETESESESETETESESESETESETGVAEKAVAGAEEKVAAETETEAETKVEENTETSETVAAESETDESEKAVAEAQTEEATEAESELHTEAATETEHETALNAESETEELTEAESGKSAVAAESETETESETTTETAAEQESEVETETQTETVTEAATELESEEAESEFTADIATLEATSFAAVANNYASLNKYVTSVNGSGTEYDPATGNFKTSLRFDFGLAKQQIIADSYEYMLDLPEGVIVPENLLGETKYKLPDKGGSVAGNYQFVKNNDGTYSVKVVFDESYVSTAGENITGHLEFKGQIDGSKTDDKGNIKIDGIDKVDIEIPGTTIKYPANETNKYDVSIKKEGTYKVGENKLIYTVIVSSLKGTPDEISFEDVILTSGMTLEAPKVKVENETVMRYSAYYDKVLETTEISPEDYQYSEITGKMTMTLPKLPQGVKKVDGNNAEYTEHHRYKVTYIYDITGMDIGTVQADNTANVSSKDAKTDTVVKDDVTHNEKIKNIYEVSKGGAVEEDKIKWTITVNANYLDVANASLTDEMLKEIANGTELKIVPDEGYTIERDSATGKITAIKFNALSDGKNTNKYEITYYTPIEAQWKDQTIVNKATFTPSTGSSIDATGNVTVSGGTLSKTMDGGTVSEDGKTSIVNWTVTMSVQNGTIPKGIVIEDKPTGNQWGGKGKKQYLTREQVVNWAGGFCWKNTAGQQIGANGTFSDSDMFEMLLLASDGKYYTYDQILENADTSLTYTVINVKLLKDLTVPAGAASLNFSYSTTADLSDTTMGDNYYYNMVSVGNKKADATYTYKKGGIIKYDGNGGTGETNTTSSGAVKWKVEVSTGEKECNSVFIKDTLPDGVKLNALTISSPVSINLTIDESGNITGSDNGYKVSGSYSNNIVQIRVTSDTEGKKIARGTKVTLNLDCEADGSKQVYENGKTYTFKNTASAKLDEVEIGSSDQTQHWTKKDDAVISKTIEKSGVWDEKNNDAKYSIVLNPDGKTLVNGTTTLVLQDVFSLRRNPYWYPNDNEIPPSQIIFEAELIRNSVKLYYGVKGEDGKVTKGQAVDGWKWVYSQKATDDNSVVNHTLTVSNIPDGCPLILEYTYAIDCNLQELANALGKEPKPVSIPSLKNEAKLEGIDETGSSNQYEKYWTVQDTSGSVSTDKSYNLYKVESGNYGKVLAGAKFALRKYDAKESEFVDTDITFTTGDNGLIHISWQKKAEDIQYEYNTLYKLVETQAPEGYILPEEDQGLYFYFSNAEDETNNMPSDLPDTAVDLTKVSHTIYVENESNTTEIRVDKKWLNKDGSVMGKPSGNIEIELYQRATTQKPSGSQDKKATVTLVYGQYNLNDYRSETIACNKGDQIIIDVDSWGDVDVRYYGTGESFWDNGIKIEAVSVSENQPKHYEYRYTVTGDITIGVLTKENGNWNVKGSVSANSSDESIMTQDTYYGTYEITAREEWTKVIGLLPLVGKSAAGKTVYYSYYIKEILVPNYNTSYENNGGITSGTITITNQSTENPSYTLPATGGPGTLPYMAGGIAVLASGLLYGYSLRRRRERRTG